MNKEQPSLPKYHYWRAFGFSWLFYLCMSFADYYDGILSWIGQPIMGVFFAGITVALVALLGLLLKVRILGNAWYNSHPLPLYLVIGGLLLLLFGSSMGLTETYIDPEMKTVHSRLHWAVSIPAYFGLLFAVAHWPSRKAVPPVNAG